MYNLICFLAYFINFCVFTIFVVKDQKEDKNSTIRVSYEHNLYFRNTGCVPVQLLLNKNFRVVNNVEQIFYIQKSLTILITITTIILILGLTSLYRKTTFY